MRAQVLRGPPHLRLLGRPREDPARPATKAQQERVDRAKEIIANLNAHGVEVTFEDAVAKAGAADAIGRPHIAKAAGAGPDLGPFFEEYLVPGAKAFVSRKWPTRRAGGRDHPRRRRRRRRRPSLLGRPGPRAGPRPGREPGPRRRPRRDRDLLPAAHRRADQALPRALRGVRPRPDRVIGLPRPHPQDLQPLGRLRHLRPRRAAGAGEALSTPRAERPQSLLGTFVPAIIASDACACLFGLFLPPVATKLTQSPSFLNL